MKKLLVFGNSQVATLLANSRKMDFPGVALMFVSQPGGGGPKGVKVDESKGILDVFNLPNKECICANQDFNYLVREKYICLNEFDSILMAGVGART